MTPEESYLLAVAGYELYRHVVLTGRPTLATSMLAERMRSPRPGDLVLEVSTLAGIRPDRWDPDRIGRLVRVEGSDPGDRWVVEPLHDPGRGQGWQNATFIALPDRYKWAGLYAVIHAIYAEAMPAADARITALEKRGRPKGAAAVC